MREYNRNSLMPFTVNFDIEGQVNMVWVEAEDLLLGKFYSPLIYRNHVQAEQALVLCCLLGGAYTLCLYSQCLQKSLVGVLCVCPAEPKVYAKPVKNHIKFFSQLQLPVYGK